MILYLVGHDYRFAIEEGVVSFVGFRPDETVVCDRLPKAPAGDYILSRLTVSGGWATASARLCFGGDRAHGLARARIADLSDFEKNREQSHALKLALYKAVTSLRGEGLPWGSLSGMRPTKLAGALMESLGERQALRTLKKRYLVSPERAELVCEAAGYGLREKARLTPASAGLYVGVPFCPSRCAYCSFVSASVDRFGDLIEPYTQALLREIERRGALCRELGFQIDSLYFGGGTPTTLSADQLDRVMTALERGFDLSHRREFTVEAGRPDTITPEKLAVLRAHGVDRISVNPQSMQPAVLEKAGRPHTPADVERAYREAREAGFRVINTDLIAGLRGDDPAGFEESVRRMIDLGPENITVHTLALKRGADLAAGETPSLELLRRAEDLPGEEALGEMLDRGNALLLEAGYRPYYLYRQKYMAGGFENVGWTKPGFQSIYNIDIMEELCTILSLGCGGVTKVLRGGKPARLSNPKYPREYITRSDAEWRAADEKLRALSR